VLSRALVRDVLDAALSTGGDFAEVFVEDRYNTQLQMVGGDLEKAVSGRDYGIGIRIFRKLNYVYAYTNLDTRDSLIEVAKTAAAALPGASQNIVINLSRIEVEDRHPIKVLPETITKQQKVDLMTRAHLAAKNYDEQISQVRVNYMDEDQKVLIANSEGLDVEDRRVRTRAMIQAIAAKGSEKQVGFYGPGAAMGFEFYDTIDIEEYSREAARTAITMINADLCPTGKMPVIIDNEFGGVIFHEACGHSLEATSVAKGSSVFSGKLGERIAADIVTAIDDGTIPNAWGSQNIDDEGRPMRHNVLIEKGILKGYMIDGFNARRMEMEPTASARRQSYRFAPTSRMTNTYIDGGESTPEEIIANTEYGLYAKYMGGGSVQPATGDFNFAVREGYLIKDGKIDRPVRGATLIGNGAEILKRIDMVGNNLALGQGMCGSMSGNCPANVGQPMVRVSEILVGGQKGDQ